MARAPAKTGTQHIIDAVHALDAAESKAADLERTLAAAKVLVDEERERLRVLVAHGRCDDECPVISRSLPAPNAKMAICWKIGFRLLEDPILDYQATAEAMWGPGLTKYVAKNRVNAQVTRLKKLGIATAEGGNRYNIDATLLFQFAKADPSKPPGPFNKLE